MDGLAACGEVSTRDARHQEPGRVCLRRFGSFVVVGITDAFFRRSLGAPALGQACEIIPLVLVCGDLLHRSVGHAQFC